MNISKESLITVNEILADVLTETEDEDFRLFTRGWYISQVQQALEELSFDTLLLILHRDFVFPSVTYAIDLPENTFNLKEIYVYNGALGHPSNKQPVRWKKNYYSHGAGKSYLANNTSDTSEDPYIIEPISSSSEGSLLYASIENGNLTFSSGCASYSFIHLVYNGTLTPIGDTPMVPQFFRQAVKLWASLEFYRRMRKRDKNYYSSIFTSTYNELYKPFTGVWHTAMKRINSMDTKVINDLKEYLSKMNANGM